MNTVEDQDLLIYDARIYTMDAHDTIAEALLITRGKIAAVGPKKYVETLAPRSWRRLSAQGATIVPGLLDTHPHLLHYGSLEEPLVKIWDCRSHEEIVGRIGQRAEAEPDGEWIQATPVGEPHFFHRRSYKDLAEGLLPDRWSLDKASTKHPIVIQAWGPVRPSCMSFNSLALGELGINRHSPERIGNVWIEKDAKGDPTGRVTGSVTNYYCYDPYGEQLWRGIPFLRLRSHVMAKPSAPTATAFDHASTLVLALELSGKSWEVGAILPGVTRRPRRSLAARDMTGLLQQIERWKAEAQRAGRTVCRTVLAYEAGRDGFWIARYLLARGIEVQIMHPASIPVERRGRRTKTDRIDLDMLLRSLLAWLRGEPRVCSMVRIPSEAEEDMRRPEREP